MEFVTAVSCSTTDLEDLMHSWNILMKHEVMPVVVPIGVVEDTPVALCQGCGRHLTRQPLRRAELTNGFVWNTMETTNSAVLQLLLASMGI